MLLPIPPALPALVCALPHRDEDADLKGMPLTSLHRETLAALKRGGYQRTRVAEDKTALIGSAIEVDLLSPTGNQRISLVFYTEDDSTVGRQMLVPESKAAAEARYTPLLKEKFPQLTLLCDEVRGKTYVTVKREVSEASDKNILEAIAETQKAIALLEGSQGATATSPTAPASPLETTLKEAKISYSDIGSFYQLKYNYTDTKRNQTAYIRKEVYTYNSLKLQEIFSLCYDRPTPPSAELLQSVFQKRFTIGGLVLEAPSEGQKNWRLRFRAMLATYALPGTLKEYLNLVAGTADNLERELNPTQEDRL